MRARSGPRTSRPPREDATNSGADASRSGGPDDAAHGTEALERAIGMVLRVGVMLSLAVVVIGLAITFAGHGSYLGSSAGLHNLTKVRGAFPHTLAGIGRGLAGLQGEAVVMLGLLLLLVTPVLRVAVSVALFALRRDRAFVIISSVVLATVLASFVLGKATGG